MLGAMAVWQMGWTLSVLAWEQLDKIPAFQFGLHESGGRGSFSFILISFTTFSAPLDNHLASLDNELNYGDLEIYYSNI